MRREVNVLQRLKENKESADRMWDRVFKEAIAGKIDKEMLANCMLQCDTSETAYWEEQLRENERRRVKESKMRMYN